MPQLVLDILTCDLKGTYQIALDLPALEFQTEDFAADQIFRTERVLSGIPGVRKLFRPPYGSWNSALSGQLNSTAARSYAGPIMWDIDAADWRNWQSLKLDMLSKAPTSKPSWSIIWKKHQPKISNSSKCRS